MKVQEVAPNIITVGGGYFGFNSAEINEAAWTAIANLVIEKMGQNPGSSLAIEGHTDSTGASDYNQNLSERRARAVRDFFVDKGIPTASMTTVGYGESKASGQQHYSRGKSRQQESGHSDSGRLVDAFLPSAWTSSGGGRDFRV